MTDTTGYDYLSSLSPERRQLIREKIAEVRRGRSNPEVEGSYLALLAKSYHRTRALLNEFATDIERERLIQLEGLRVAATEADEPRWLEETEALMRTLESRRDAAVLARSGKHQQANQVLTNNLAWMERWRVTRAVMDEYCLQGGVRVSRSGSAISIRLLGHGILQGDMSNLKGEIRKRLGSHWVPYCRVIVQHPGATKMPTSYPSP